MARTTEEAVQTLLETGGDYDTEKSPSLAVFVSSASVVTSRTVTCAARKGITISDEEAELIERWLGAHYYCQSDQPYLKKQTLDASATYQGVTGKRLESTKYGQSALSLDPSGCLKMVTSGRRATARWAGKRKSEEIPYDQRS